MMPPAVLAQTGSKGHSVLKSGPVRFLALQGLRPRPRPVHDFQKRKKTGPRLQKTEDHGPLRF